ESRSSTPSRRRSVSRSRPAPALFTTPAPAARSAAAPAKRLSHDLPRGRQLDRVVERQLLPALALLLEPPPLELQARRLLLDVDPGLARRRPCRADRVQHRVGRAEQRSRPPAFASGRRDPRRRLEALGDGPRLVQPPDDREALLDEGLRTVELSPDHDRGRKRALARTGQLGSPAQAREGERLLAARD